MGYYPIFDRKENFYKTKEEEIGKFTLCVNIILQGGMVDLVWVVKENGELLLCARWSTYSRRLIDSSYRIKKPVFGTYAEGEERQFKSLLAGEEFRYLEQVTVIWRRKNVSGYIHDLRAGDHPDRIGAG